MQKFCVHCGKEVENLENLNFCPFCGGKNNTHQNTLNSKINDSISNAKELAVEKYEIDPTTKISTKVGYFEKRLFIYNKIFFWTILFYPLMIVLNDIYENKFVHNNKFWIKKAISYGIFLSVTYFLLLITSQTKMDYVPINIFLIFGVLYLAKLLQEKFGHLLFIKEKEEKLSENEIQNVIEIQKIDLDEKNQKIKTKFRIIFILLFTMINIIIFQFQSHYLATLLSVILIVTYDNYEQKYLKRDKIKFFWKKRKAFYFFVIFPVLLCISFLIYDTLIFKY